MTTQRRVRRETAREVQLIKVAYDKVAQDMEDFIFGLTNRNLSEEDYDLEYQTMFIAMNEYWINWCHVFNKILKHKTPAPNKLFYINFKPLEKE